MAQQPSSVDRKDNNDDYDDNDDDDDDNVRHRPRSSKSSSTRFSYSSSLTLHDYLSLGEVEEGLSSSSTTTTSSIQDKNRAKEEMERLPVLLRLLSSMRTLVHPPIFLDNDHDHEDDDNKGKQDDTKGKKMVGIGREKEGDSIDTLVYQTVEQLEHVAALHSVAEGVDVVMCYLAPTMTRALLSKVSSPMKKKRRRGTKIRLVLGYDTTELQDALEVFSKRTTNTNTGNSDEGNKRRRNEAGALNSEPANDDDEFDEDDDHNDDDDDDDEESLGATRLDRLSDEEGEHQDVLVDGSKNSGNQKKRKQSPNSTTTAKATTTTKTNVPHSSRRKSSMGFAAAAIAKAVATAEDSQDATVVKALTELISLVVASLDPISSSSVNQDDRQDDDHEGGGGGKDNGTVANNKHADQDNNDDTNKNKLEEGPMLPETTGNGKGRLVLSVEDSILAEMGSWDGTVNPMDMNDVGSTIAAILHYAPVLKSQHVAVRFAYEMVLVFFGGSVVF